MSQLITRVRGGFRPVILEEDRDYERLPYSPRVNQKSCLILPASIIPFDDWKGFGVNRFNSNIKREIHDVRIQHRKELIEAADDYATHNNAPYFRIEFEEDLREYKILWRFHSFSLTTTPKIQLYVTNPGFPKN